jgi:hypothetical protein
LLALQGEDGQWAGGARFPARGLDWRAENQGQPWTATLPTLQLLHDFGVDPRSEPVRRAVTRVRDHCRWEHAGQPFFSGEVEPCINGRTVALGTYFDQDVDEVAARLVGGAARGRRMELRGGERLRPLVVRDHDQRPGRTLRARARDGWLRGVQRRSTPRRGIPARAQAAPTQEHRRHRPFRVASVLVHFALEDGDGRPSRWNTLRALRVLRWYEQP